MTDNLQAGGRVHKQLQYNLSFDAVEVQRYSSIIQRHIATVSNIDKASNPYISSMVSISNNMIWYETEMKFVDQKERNVANEDSFLYILYSNHLAVPPYVRL